jgi:chromatin segregation and condensation protein Rec8/ScpA/Scc1 (kleisin family)
VARSKDEIKEYKRQYYLKNKDKVTAKNKKWRKDHQEKVKEYNTQYYTNNSDRLKQIQMNIIMKIKMI